MWMGLKSCEISANLIWSSSENIINILDFRAIDLIISFISAKLYFVERKSYVKH